MSGRVVSFLEIRCTFIHSKNSSASHLVPISSHSYQCSFLGKRKEIRGMGCRELLTLFETQDINWTQMTLPICCKCFQLILQGFSLDTRRTSHLFFGSLHCKWPTSHPYASAWQVTESIHEPFTSICPSTRLPLSNIGFCS